jgi:hypothetical protein
MARKRSRRRAGKALPAANRGETLNLISILPLLLANQDGKLLRHSPTKQSLRLTCKGAKAAIDPTIRGVKIPSSTAIIYDNHLFNAFSRSPLTLAATKLYSEFRISRNCMSKLIDIQFNHVQDVSFQIDSNALDLLASQWKCGRELKVLDLLVHCQCRIDTLSQLNSVWKEFSKSNWPLLETLSLAFFPDYGGLYDDDDDSGPGPDVPDLDYREVARLLSYFPSLKCLKVQNSLSLPDIQAIAAVPHEKLERLELFLSDQAQDGRSESGFMAALAGAKWPKLQELKLNDFKRIPKDDVDALSKASWFDNLKTLHLVCSDHYHETAMELFGLQFGALETLKLDNFHFDGLLTFKDPMQFPSLKTLSISVFGLRQHANSSENPFNAGLSSFFSNTKLPCLESLNISTHSGSFNIDAMMIPWNIPPSFANNNTVEPTVLPSLKRLVMQGFRISQDCSAFLGSFYSRGDFEVDLHRCRVESNLDSPEFDEILTFFSLRRFIFDEKLKSLKLYEKAVWYNLFSIDALKSIVASMYLSNVAGRIDGLLEKVTASVALTEPAGATQQRSVQGELLQKSHKEVLEAISRLNLACGAGNNGGSSGGGG